MAAGIAFRIERDELHERLGGQLPRGALGLADGEPGSGRSVLLQRLLYGAVQNGHRCTYLTTEHTTRGFLRQMHTLGYDVGRAAAEGKLLLLTAFPSFARRAPPGDGLARMVAAKTLWERDLVIIDDFSVLVDQCAETHGDVEARRQVDLALHRCRLANASGTTVVLTSDRNSPRASLLQPLKAMAELLLDLRVELVGASLARRMLVRRLAGAPERTGDTMGFRVEPGMGILVEIRSVT